MSSLVPLLATAPEVEIESGLLYIVIDGQRHIAYTPHVARVANERIRRALDAMDAANSEKVVAFR